MNMTIPYIVIIQAAYTDERLSLQRLEISRHTAIPALAYQEERPVVHIAVHPNDPYLDARITAFESSGCEIKPLMRTSWKLYKENWELPEGRKIVSRLDDDDVIAKDFCRRNRTVAPVEGEHALLWPKGYVFWRQQIFLLQHPGIQFVTLITDRMTDPHQEQHWQYPKLWHTVVVSHEPGWIWVRHGDAATSTLPRYRKNQLSRIDSKRVPINLRAIIRAIAPSGLASGSYAEKADQIVLRHVLKENERNSPRPTLKFAIAITTYSASDRQCDRKDLLRTVESCRRTSDRIDLAIHVFDDGSDPAYREYLQSLPDVHLHMSEQNEGISAAKNRCLNLFREDPSLEVLFMLDDDVEFLRSGWINAYSDGLHRVPLLSFNDPEISGTNGIDADGLLRSEHTCGVLVAITRDCWNRVGEYAAFPEKYGCEHTEYYRRASIAGVVPVDGYYDISGSDRFLRIASNDGGTGTPKEQQVEINMASDAYQSTERAYFALRGTPS